MVEGVELLLLVAVPEGVDVLLGVDIEDKVCVPEEVVLLLGVQVVLGVDVSLLLSV